MQASSARTIGKERMGEWIGRLIENAEVIAPAAAQAGDVIFRRSPRRTRSSGAATTRCSRRSRSCCRRPTRSSRSAAAATGSRSSRSTTSGRGCSSTCAAATSRGSPSCTRMHAYDLADTALPAARRRADLGQPGVHDAVPARLLHLLRRRAVPGRGVRRPAHRPRRPLPRRGGQREGRAVLVEPSADLFRPAQRRGGGAAARARGGGEARVRRRDLPLRLGDAARLDRPGERRAVGRDAPTRASSAAPATSSARPATASRSRTRRRDGHWVRCRTWDSCQFRAFTLEASGHNPREAHRERVKRRFFHKVSAQYFRRDGAVGLRRLRPLRQGLPGHHRHAGRRGRDPQGSVAWITCSCRVWRASPPSATRRRTPRRSTSSSATPASGATSRSSRGSSWSCRCSASARRRSASPRARPGRSASRSRCGAPALLTDALHTLAAGRRGRPARPVRQRLRRRPRPRGRTCCSSAAASGCRRCAA